MYALPLLDPTVFLAILSALKLADLVTTRAVLKLDGSERNKVMVKLFEKLGIDGALILTGAIVVALGYAMAVAVPTIAAESPWATWLPWMLLALYVWVVIHNLQSIRTLKKWAA